MDLRRLGGHLVALGLLLAAPPPAAADLVPEPDPDAVLGALLWAEVGRLPEADRPRLALALGGGGARGLAHVGVLRALEERAIGVDAIAGTSIGAFVGALYATGAPAAEIERIGLMTNWNNLSEIGLLSWPGLLSARRLETFINAHLRDLSGREEEVTFADLRRRFACVAADLETGEEVVFRDGPVGPAVRASCAVPGLFDPFTLGGRTLIDGGVVNNLPVDLARALGGDVVAAVDVEAAPPEGPPGSPVEVLVRVIRIQGARITAGKRALADVVVRPAVGGIGITELERAPEAIRAGRVAGAASATALRAAVIARALPEVLRRGPAFGAPAAGGLPIAPLSAPASAPAGVERRDHRKVLERARAAAAAGDWETVSREVGRLGGWRGRAEAERLAAGAALRLGILDEALLHADRAVRTDESPPEAWALLGLAALAAGREGAPQVALAAFDEAGRRGRPLPFWRAWALDLAGRAEDAAAAYREAAAAGGPAAEAARVRLAWAGEEEGPREGPAVRIAAAVRAAAKGDRAGALRRIEGVEGRLADALRATVGES